MGAMKVLDREPREDADSSEHFSYDDEFIISSRERLSNQSHDLVLE